MSTEFQKRREAWCKATGLKISKARITAVLRWLDDYRSGFDHTGVYYWPEKGIHILITEPYRSTREALESMKRCATIEGKRFAYSVGANDQGLWNPGSCFALLIAGDEAGEYLYLLAAALPSTGEN